PQVDALQTGDVVGTAPTQAYDTKNVGTGKTLTASGLVINDGNSGNNYHILYATNNTGVITVRDINVTAQHDDRIYNGTTSSSVAPQVDALQTGDLVGTAPTQAYDTKNVGTGKTLTASGLVINDGNSGNNYHIIYTTNTTGVITVRDINVTAKTDSRIYNGTTSSSVAPQVDALQTGDLIGTAPTQVYDTKHVGSNKTLTASGLVINDGNSGNNYHIIYTTNTTGVITVRDINVTAKTDSRVYNGTTSSSVVPQVDALQTGDLIGTAPAQVYDTKHVGSNKTLTASGLVINDGNSGNNYHIIYTTNTTGVISVRDINVTAQTDSRVYNG
ncbi:YDG domain-containing protein, partial [Niastella vici]|uniref:YDG domain-containing protein n=1 Tax=Niastella vici TaxID=1703345 RepID=UPI001C1F5542